MSMLDVAIRRARAGHFPVNAPPPARIVAPPPILLRPAVSVTTETRKPWGAPLVVQVTSVVPEHTISRLIRIVAKFYGFSRVDMLSVRRPSQLATARHVAMYLAKETTTYSFPEIGRRFGGRDHSTVMYAIRRITDKINNSAALATEVDSLRELLAA